MDIAAKQEIARAMIETHRTREASYIKGTFRYGTSYEEAAKQAVPDADLRPLVVAMLAAGYADLAEWADKMLLNA